MGKSTCFHLPNTNLMGVGSLSNLGKELVALGYKKALIVTDKNLVKLGHVGKVEQILKDNNIAYTIFDGVERPNPNVTFVENGYKYIQDERNKAISPTYDFVISVGGGSNHDTARSIAALATNGGSIVNYEGSNKFTKPILPWVAVNTTAGSGAHVTMFNIITDDSRKTAMTISDPKLLATLTVDDPELQLSMPREVTISSGIDVLAHAVEAYVALNATPFTDALALGAIKLVFNNLKRVAVNGNDLETRENMAYATDMAATAFNNAGLGHTHTIAHQIDGASYRHHGLTTGALLPYVLEFNAPSIPVQRFIDMAIAMGETGVTGFNAVETVLTAIRKFNETLGIPTDLSELGAKDEDIKYYAEMALKDISGSANPRQATLEDMIQLIRTCMGVESSQKPGWEQDKQFDPIAMLANNAERLSANDLNVDRT
ncbi:iron-containing alcohol dehydrogenase [Desulfosporosinus sp. OT]|uniref:iron-containing alcohol dehydrogenase n=1 Tax=Desulfosporosinus sp. OT TaxID=913865 RepID=UPI000223ABDF|nr:iron-containing alcohol dehydrogenase [Desulfosporosinus sp. OT]EGW40324.1 NAD-dependent methanol dehydrogenase [Desulfosporosinus sp. OT]